MINLVMSRFDVKNNAGHFEIKTKLALGQPVAIYLLVKQN